jgi:hypothetical protein
MCRSPRSAPVQSSTLACAAALSLAVPALAEDEIVVSRRASGQLVVLVDADQPIAIERSVFPGITGFATGLTGFHSTDLNEPLEDRFMLDPAADIQAIFLGADPGIQIYNGVPVMHPGDAMSFGLSPFDYHPVFNIFAGFPGDVFTVRFIFHDQSGTHSDSDAVAVTFTPAASASCPADLTGDGHLNVADFLRFLALYAAADPRADADGDGRVNIADFLAFLGAYSAGCP